MEFSQLHNFLKKLNVFRMKRNWRMASKGETNSKISDEDIREVTFELAKEKVTDVIEEVDKNFDTHYNEPRVVRDIYSKKLKEFKNAEGFSDEECKMINSKIKFIEKHIRKRLKEYDLENEPPTEETFKENELREIDSYKNAIKYSDFNIAKNRKEGGKLNDLYYNTLLVNWKKNQLKDYKNSLQEFQDFLPDYLQTVYYVLGKTSKLFDFITRYEPEERSHKTVLNLKKGEIKDYLEILGNYNLDIRRIEIMKGKESALSLQKVCLLIYDEGLEALKQLGISIYKSPLVEDFQKARLKIAEACSPEQITKQQINENSYKKRSLPLNKTPLEDFFTDKATPKQIKAIQEAFKDLDNKEIAALIYLLDHKGFISYNNSIKPKSRLNFVRAFKDNEELQNIWGISKFFQRHSNDTALVDPKGNKDKTLIIIEEQLTKVVAGC